MQAEFRTNMKHLAQASGLAIFGQVSRATAIAVQRARLTPRRFCQFLGGTIGLAVGEAVFSSELRSNIAKYAPTAPFKLVQESPLAIYTDLDPSLIAQVVVAYVKSLDIVYIVCVPAAGLSIILAIFIKNIDIRPPEKKGQKGKKATKKEEQADKEASSEPEDASEKV